MDLSDGLKRFSKSYQPLGMASVCYIRLFSELMLLKKKDR